MRKLLALFSALSFLASAALAQSGITTPNLPVGSTMVPTDMVVITRNGVTIQVPPYNIPSSGSILVSTGNGISLTGITEVDGNCVTGISGRWQSAPCTSGIITGTPVAGNLAKFASASTITNANLTGDVTTSGGTATTLASVNSNVGTFGSSTSIPNFTVNVKGLVTGAGSNAVVAPAGTLTGTILASNVVTSSLTGVGTLTSGATGSGFTLNLGSSTISGLLPSANLPAPFTSGTASGNTSKFATASGTLTNGHCVQIDSSGNFVDAGGVCTTGGGGGTVNAGTAGQVAYYQSSTNAVSGESLSTLLDSAIGSTQGDLLYRSASAWSVLAPGTSGNFLQTQGASANPQWAAGNAGTVTTTGSPASGNLARFSGGTSVTNTDLTGDITTSGTAATTLATVNGNTGSFGSSTAIPNFTVNAKGLITAAGTNAVIAPAGTLTGTTLAAGVTGSSLTGVGTLTSGATGTGFTVALGTSTLTGTLPAGNFPALTGDLTTPGGNLATTLATVNPNVGTYNGITVNAKGLVTAAQFTNDAAVLVATTGNLNATYSNGSSGVGATLTNAGTQAALVIDGVALSSGNRVLVWQQTTTFQNGIYAVTNVGSGSTNWVLTRATDFDGSTTGNVFAGATVPVIEGTQYGAYFFIETGVGPFTLGTTPIVFSGNSSANTILPNGSTAATVDVRSPLYGAKPDAKKLQSCTISSGSAALTCSGASFLPADAGKSIRIYDITNSNYVFSGTLLTYGSSTTFTLSGNASNACTSTNCLAAYGTDNAAAIQAALNAAQALASSLVAGGTQNFPLGAGAPRVVFPIDSRGDGYLFNSTLTTTCCNVVIDADAMLYPNTGFGTADRTWAMFLASGTHIKHLVTENLGNSGIHIGDSTSGNSRTKIDDLQEWTVGNNFSSSQPALTATVVGQGTSGWNVNDTITLTGGTCSQQPILTVTAVSGGKVTAANVTTPGACTVLAANPVSQGSRTGSGVGTTTWTMAWGDNSQTALEIAGFDFEIKKFWENNANIGFHINGASDVFVDQLELIGSSTGLVATSGENIHISNAVCDTNSFECAAIDGSRNAVMNIRAFSVVSTTLTTGLAIGTNDNVNENRGLVINYSAQRTGGVGANLSNLQDSTINLNLTNSALYSGSGGNMTKGLIYGSGNTGSLDVTLNMDPNIASTFSGTVTGILKAIIGNNITFFSPTFTIASGCGTPGSLTGTATTGSFTAGQAACAPVLTLPAAADGWFCSATDITHPADLFTQTAKSTTSCTLSATVTSSDVIVFNAVPY